MINYDLNWLHASINEGQKHKYLHFWGHTPSRKGQIDQSCLSQWYPAPFTEDGIQYPTAEHYMMAAKARLFGDDERLEQILATRHPGATKRLGRQVSPFQPERWEQHRFDIVVAGNLAKFSQNSLLNAYLQKTEQRILVEASPIDTIWGIGLAAADPNASNPEQWPGQNLLGFALMKVRALLAESE